MPQMDFAILLIINHDSYGHMWKGDTQRDLSQLQHVIFNKL